MANNEHDYAVASQMRYLANDGKHYLSDVEQENTYWKAFYGAYLGYKKGEVTPGKEVVEEAVVAAEPVYEDKVVTKKRWFAIILTLIATAAFIALAALSYFAVLKDFTYFFGGAGSKELFNVFFTDINGMEIGDIIMTFAVPGTACLAALLAIVTFIIAIVALCVKNKVNAMGILSVIALAAWIACGILMYFAAGVATDSEAIIAYINPLAGSGVAWGYYIGAALLLIATIFGFLCYGKKTVKVEVKA